MAVIICVYQNNIFTDFYFEPDFVSDGYSKSSATLILLYNNYTAYYIILIITIQLRTSIDLMKEKRFYTKKRQGADDTPYKLLRTLTTQTT